MKRILIFVLFTVITAIASAQHNEHFDRGSRLYLKMRDNSMFSVKFDGQFYNEYSDRFSIRKLHPGWHRLAVFQRSPHGSSRIVYRGGIDIPENSKVYAVINRHNELVVSKIVPIDNGHSGHYENNYNQVTLNMQQLNYTLDNASFESDKLTIAKQAISSNGVYADQVLAIINTFSFESTRLEFAKFAYRYCADKNNYYVVNNGFSFNSTITELNSYVSSQGDYSRNNDGYNDNHNNNYRDDNHSRDNNQNNRNGSNDDNDEDGGGDW